MQYKFMIYPTLKILNRRAGCIYL